MPAVGGRGQINRISIKGSQRDPTQIETPLNWPPERAGSSVEGTRLARTQKALWRQVVKARADKLDLKIRALHPANPVYMARTKRDQHSTMFATVIPTEQYNLTNEELCGVNELGNPQPRLHPSHWNQTCAECSGGRR